eukprot:TRINITY_DN3149_c0_g2_i2.p1 TRINITY_DN3149_c0_g2~~TRINITY_DN3149_c0_g2_i2.p1  ORF type:complete len:426 (+),score=72.72 TRINITY_DN3149_c0_g2_i2:12-1289(+)
MSFHLSQVTLHLFILTRPCELAAERLDGKWVDLLRWLQEGIYEEGLGSHSDWNLSQCFEVQDSARGRGLFSKCEFERGNILVMLPKTRLITLDKCASVSYGSKLDPVGKLAYCLARQRTLGSKSSLAPYISTLPHEHGHLPKHWEKSIWRKYFEGSSFREYVKHKRRECKRAYKSFGPPEHLAFDSFEWGWDIVRTRGSGMQYSNDEDVMIFPLLDFANHDHNSNIHISLNRRFEALLVKASRRIHAGDELLMSYWDAGTTTAWQVLETWGFMSQETRAEVAVAVMPDDLAEIQRKVLGQGKAKLGPVLFSLTDEPDDSNVQQFFSYLDIAAQTPPRMSHMPSMPLNTEESDLKNLSSLSQNALRIGHLILDMALARYGPDNTLELPSLEENHFATAGHELISIEKGLLLSLQKQLQSAHSKPEL